MVNFTGVNLAAWQDVATCSHKRLMQYVPCELHVPPFNPVAQIPRRHTWSMQQHNTAAFVAMGVSSPLGTPSARLRPDLGGLEWNSEPGGNKRGGRRHRVSYWVRRPRTEEDDWAGLWPAGSLHRHQRAGSLSPVRHQHLQFVQKPIREGILPITSTHCLVANPLFTSLEHSYTACLIQQWYLLKKLLSQNVAKTYFNF